METIYFVFLIVLGIFLLIFSSLSLFMGGISSLGKEKATNGDIFLAMMIIIAWLTILNQL